MPVVRDDLFEQLNNLTCDVLKSLFLTCQVPRRLRKTDIINTIVEKGLTVEQHTLLENLIEDKKHKSDERRSWRLHRRNGVRRDCRSNCVPTTIAIRIQRPRGPYYTAWRPFVVNTKRTDCPYCHAWHFIGEIKSFCCNNGKYIAPRLPTLPPQFDTVLTYRDISKYSRRLNNLFAFTSIGASDGGGSSMGFYNQNAPAFVAAHGRVYHRLFAGNHSAQNSMRWYLYDQMEDQVNAGIQWKLPEHVILAARAGLESVNPYIRILRSLGSEAVAQDASIQLRAHVAEGEVSAILCTDDSTVITPRQVRIWPRSETEFTYISSLSPFYESLHYVIIFPDGNAGWTSSIPLDSALRQIQNNNDSYDQREMTQIWRYRSYFLREERFLRFGRLGQEYAVDMFSRVQEARLSYIYQNQKRLRQEEAELMGDDHDLSDHDNIFLPSSFLGSRRWCSNQTADALCLARWGGQPTFFITMTCNPKWPEIRTSVPPSWNLKSSDLPSIAIRSFKVRLMQLFYKDLTLIFGAPRYRVHVIEFQKRGLPHAHIAIKVTDTYIDPHEIDSVVSACLPSNSDDRVLVEDFMLHKHRGLGGTVGLHDGCRTTSGTCRFGYPKPLSHHTHIDPNTGYVIYQRQTENDRWVVPHNIHLLRRHLCHINVEIAGTTTLFQYLYKYLYKGPDFTSFRINSDVVDEIKDYWRGRYVSSSEALWRLYGYHSTKKIPAVECLPIHLPGKNIQKYTSSTSSTSISKLERYFLRPDCEPFRSQTYTQYFERNVIGPCSSSHLYTDYDILEQQRPHVSPYIVKPRDMSTVQKLARIISLKPSHGEAFYLRLILQRRPVKDFNDARTYNGTLYVSYQEAAIAHGYIDTTNEGYLAFEEAIQNLATPAQLRFLFTELISNGTPAIPLWDSFSKDLAKDFAQKFSLELAINKVLLYIQSVLDERGQSLDDFHLPNPVQYSPEIERELERWSLNKELLADEAHHHILLMNTDQQCIFHRIISAIDTGSSLLLFIQARAGRGKTFIIDTLCQKLRSQSRIVVPTATTALAASIYPGGRTTHSLYGVPVEEHATLLKSKISLNSARAHLLRATAVHIIDECPMANKAVIYCIDDLLRYLHQCNEPFGNTRIVFLGDWAQIPPVVKGSSRAATVAASIKSSYLWPQFDIMHLSIPIRNASDPCFAQWLDFLAENEEPSDIDIPYQLINTCYDRDDLITFTFPTKILNDPIECAKRAIICPVNVQVSEYNDLLLNQLHGAQCTYYSTDSVDEDDVDDDPLADIDQLNSMRLPGIPNHELHLKVGAICVLTRNFSIQRGLTKNTKVIIQQLGTRVIVAKVLQNSDIILLPRIDFTYYFHDKGWTIRRRQFPLRLAYAITINSVQGMTLDHIGFDCTHPVFSHGQLYTAFSRVRLGKNCMIRISPEMTTIKNVVYTELL